MGFVGSTPVKWNDGYSHGVVGLMNALKFRPCWIAKWFPDIHEKSWVSDLAIVPQKSWDLSNQSCNIKVWHYPIVSYHSIIIIIISIIITTTFFNDSFQSITQMMKQSLHSLLSCGFSESEERGFRTSLLAHQSVNTNPHDPWLRSGNFDQHIEDVEDMLDRICGDMFLSKSCREIFGFFVAELWSAMPCCIVEGERFRICVLWLPF